MDTREFLTELRNLGIKLSVENGRLRSESAKGVLTPELQAAIRERKEAIVDFLTAVFGDAEMKMPIAPVDRDQSLPLSYAQQRLWFIHEHMPGQKTTYNLPAA